MLSRKARRSWVALALVACRNPPHEGSDASATDAASVPSTRSSESVTKSHGSLIPVSARRVLEGADDLELLVLGPPSGAGTRDGGAGVLLIPFFRNPPLAFPIVGSVRLTEPNEIAAVRDAVVADLIPEATAGWAFEPLHAIRARRGAESVVVAICYECASAVIVGPDGSVRTGAASKGVRLLNEILGKHGVPLFRAPAPAVSKARP